MTLKLQRARTWLDKRSRQSRRGFPLATMVFYGPDDQQATKLCVTVHSEEGVEPVLKRWFSDEHDIRTNNSVTIEAVDFLKGHAVQRVLAVDGIFGCPHEEGIDYPEGEVCPRCPFWAHRDRSTGELMDDETARGPTDDDRDDTPLVYSSQCQVLEQDGVTLEVKIYRGPVDDGWLLEVVNPNGSSIVWDDLFQSDDDAWLEFQQTLQEEGLSAFSD